MEIIQTLVTELMPLLKVIIIFFAAIFCIKAVLLLFAAVVGLCECIYNAWRLFWDD